MSEIFENVVVESTVLLDKMLNNESVSRWDIYRLKKTIRCIMNESDKYDSVKDEVNFLIESAKESL